ncbi:MAG: hypothetical protein IJ530_08465 [Treponema sp.]|uniref:hypothetical protein n=1 Tax=Treponema sp. TaxID=166 RepID=UPI0025D8733D|nr:hypothetical protein [Treponema sp.]MBQ8679785.1 hypothetical protein [Treponema sp.]
MENKTRILLILLFLFSALPVFSQNATFFQKIEWKSNANALEYKVEIQNTASGKSQFITTEKTSTEISLLPGKYRYRVYAYDFLGKEASVSAWTNFEVYKASKPKITSVEKSITLAENSDSISINVNIADINANSTYELVNESLQGSVDSKTKAQLDTGSETDSVSKLNFKNVPPGKWRLKVTNGSGLSALSDIIEIKGEDVKTISDEEVKKIRDEAAENAKKEAFAESEAKIEEERKSFEEERANFEKERANYEKERLNLEEELAALREKKAKEDWKAAHPYIYKDFIFEVGAGLTISPYDGSIKDYTGESAALSLGGKIAYLPIKSEKNKFGLQLGLLSNEFETKKDSAYNLKLEYSVFDLSIVWHRKLSKKTFLALKGGLGIVNIEKHVSYQYYSLSRASDISEKYTYPEFSAGASLFFTPWKFLVFETGFDFNHIMATGMTTGFITPYACLGFRF